MQWHPDGNNQAQNEKKTKKKQKQIKELNPMKTAKDRKLW